MVPQLSAAFLFSRKLVVAGAPHREVRTKVCEVPGFFVTYFRERERQRESHGMTARTKGNLMKCKNYC